MVNVNKEYIHNMPQMVTSSDSKKRSNEVWQNTHLKGNEKSKGTLREPLNKIPLMDLYHMSCNKTEAHNIENYKDVVSTNYEIKVRQEGDYVDIYDKQGNDLGAYLVDDLEIKIDANSGKKFLISDHGGSTSYDAIVLDEELMGALCKVMGKNQLSESTLEGYQLKTHTDTGIQFLVRDGEEGRGGKVLLQNASDVEQYNKLAQTYMMKYPNLIKSEEAALIYADLEIKGLTKRTEEGIITLGFNGVSYKDHNNYKNNWCVLFSEESYKMIFDWFEKNSENSNISKNSFWNILNDVKCERIWSKEELNQGYLNN